MMKHLHLAVAVVAFTLAAPIAKAEIDGHGPDSWRVFGVAANDVLNARLRKLWNSR